jgi:hypothetical protein
MLDPAENFEYKGVKVTIYYDELPANPRIEFDNLGTVVGWKQPRYRIGDQQLSIEYRSPAELVAELRASGARLILPVHYSPQGGYLCSSEHDDKETIENSDGVIYATATDIRNEYGLTRISAKALERAMRVLQGEIAEYSAYLSGEVYGFIISGPDGEELDSCWGFYERDYCEQSAKDAAEHQAQLLVREAIEANEMACRGVQTVAWRKEKMVLLLHAGSLGRVQAHDHPTSGGSCSG